MCLSLAGIIEAFIKFSIPPLVKSALTKKSGGDRIINQYNRTKGLTDSTRQQMVSILAAEMTETH
ncbi:hypothetical protein NQZ68_001088 [Dissostichus eleginoides]|nr:hypothetical protein NQZ68_001088 [Dissostichus eleginoides]